jgi:hypothetical protein
MTPEVENEILKLKLKIAELELKIERMNGMVYIPPNYPPTIIDPYLWPPYIVTCDTKNTA